MHLCIRINQSYKQFLQSSFVRLSMACSKAVSISLSSLSQIPHTCSFSFGNKKSQGLKGGIPLQHTLIFCQFVESDPKGLVLKYLAGWMLFGRVIKISKIEKMRFSSYFDACDESSSYLAFRSYEALEKKLFVGSISTG